MILFVLLVSCKNVNENEHMIPNDFKIENNDIIL